MNAVMQWAERNRILIASLSVAGSFAGLVFSILDLQTSIQERQLKELLKK